MSNQNKLELVKIPAGEYRRGGGDWDLRPDALPVHTVTLSEDFLLSREPVSYALYLDYCAECGLESPDVINYKNYVAGVSWQNASDFCAWLSVKENKPYRLPTEAEWEYAARTSLATGADRFCDQHLREWCFDWYSSYSAAPQINPAGSKTGWYKVIRGGYLDNPTRYNEHPLDVWMRCALPKNYRHFPEDIHNEFGRHLIGFRVVQAEMPQVNGEFENSLVTRLVKQNWPAGKVQNQLPYFRKRHLLPTPPDNATPQEIRNAGLNPLFRHHHHSPGLTALPNGDLLFAAYSTYHEYDAESGLIGARLRYGADQWDFPDMIANPVGVNDHAPLLFTDDDGTVYLFWGWQQLDNSFPFQYIYSKDNGENWSETIFPLFTNKAQRVVKQPINSMFRGQDGTYYLACDASGGAASVLWRSKDLLHWEDPVGRTGGRHSTAVERKDGSLYVLGGKNSEIDGYMPQSVSKDMGTSWQVSASPFPMLTSGQRPTLLRLASGALLACGDYQSKQGDKPNNFANRKGSYAAYSFDDGETWTIKNFWGAQERKKDSDLFSGQTTLGYSVSCQSPDGLIHVVSSNTQPVLHFCFNEAWLFSEEQKSPGESALIRGEQESPLIVEQFCEEYPSGALRCSYSGGLSPSGRFLLHGEEKWYYENGKPEAAFHFKNGQRIGRQTYYRKNGQLLLEWEHFSHDLACFTTFYEDGTPRSMATYRGKVAEGLAQTFSENGEVISESWFADGKIVKQTDLRRAEPAPVGEIIEAP